MRSLIATLLIFLASSASAQNIGTVTSGSIGGTTTFSGASASVSNTTQSTSPTTGALLSAGGLGVGGNAFIGGNLVIAGQTYFGSALGQLGGAAGGFISLPVADGNRLEIQRTASANNYVGTRAALVVQQSDAEALGGIGPGNKVPSFVMDAVVTGQGTVSLGPNLSSSFWTGLQVSMTKSNDGSGQAITTIGNLGTCGSTCYNELSLLDGTATNNGSTNGYISLVEVIAQDSGNSGATSFDTTMYGGVFRIHRYHNGSKLSVALVPSSEGIAADWILKPNAAAPDLWKGGFDLSHSSFSTGIVFTSPNATQFNWLTSGGLSQPVLGVSNVNVTYLRPVSNSAYSDLEDFQGVPVLRAINYGGTSAVNWLEVLNAATGSGLTIRAAGSDANIPISFMPKGTGAVVVGGAVNLTAGNTYLINTTQVVGPRDTGWTAMTGTPDKSTSYATSTITLAQLAGRVMQLQASLTTHGLIGP